MAFATTADITLTGGDIITEALEICGVLAEGESPSTEQNTSALRTLNNIIKSLSADVQIFAQDEYTLNLVASTGTYSLGVSNVGYIPNKILNATLINTADGNEIPIRKISQQEWYALTDKTTESRVTHYFTKRNPVGVDMDLYVWPVPSDTTYDMKMWIQYPYRDVDATTEDVWFTQEWYLALSFLLAHALSFKYGLPRLERDAIKEEGEKFQELAESYDTDGSIFLQPSTKNG